EALLQFGAGATEVLLGTQMISKGLDFPNVTLVGVLNADLAMTMPDFRAAERTFQLICQVAGRAGRPSTGGGRGLVVVQTYQPQEPAIVHACNHDYAGFRTTELPHRAALGLPPYGRLARLVFSDKNHDKARDVAAQVATLITQIATRQNLPVKLPGSGPVPPPMERLAEEYRWEIVLEAPSAGPLQKVLATLRARGVFAKCPVGVAVDVDPVRMM
ncbi:MAG: helicase-related protein, partial [Phycisphaerae bacterium]